MAEKIKKGIPWFLIVALFALVAVIVLDSGEPTAEAVTEVATTTVTVGNTAPSWVAVYEDPESSTSSPTNVGSSVTFEGRADDPNGDSWYLLICSSSAAIATSSTGDWPTCSEGTWATSSAADNATATATYTTNADDSENSSWWAWACDDSASNDQLCTAVSQGTGATDAQYSPFAVNHAPTLTALDDGGPIDPGGTVTIYASTTDPDTGSSDWLTFYVCKGSDGTSSGCGAGGTWCSATGTADVSCNYTDTAPTDDQAYTYYGYIFDNHSFEADPASDTENFVISNVAPTVSSVNLNSGSAITLTEEATTSVSLSATVSDNNECSDLSSALASAYRQASSSDCTAWDDNFCYYQMSCSVSGCEGGTADATATCDFYMWYHADPTVASTTWSSDIWDALVKAIDDDDASSTATSSTPVEMNTTLGIDIDTGAINYGSVSAGSDSGTLNATSTIAETGNCSLDVNTTSTDMVYGATGTIAVNYQQYDTSSGTSYGSGTNASSTDQEIELNLAKTTSTSSQSTASVYWGLEVPSGTPAGTYAGETKYEAVLNETPWP